MERKEGCYVIDDLENIGKYAGLSANFKIACDFIARGDFGSLSNGRNDISGDDVFVNAVEAQYVKPEDRKPEFHRHHFDIHVPLAADEKIGLAQLDPAAVVSYDEGGDGGFAEQGVEWFVIGKGQFCITWPATCAHAPAVTTDVEKKARKLIVKVSDMV